MARRGFGDETWRLANDADAAALRDAADRLGEDVAYDSHRARAFALAVDGRRDDALAELNEGWSDEWPFPAAHALDVARVQFLAGDYAHALIAVELSVCGGGGHDGSPLELAVACVRRQPGLLWRALRLALTGGSLPQRGWSALAVLGARLARNP